MAFRLHNSLAALFFVVCLLAETVAQDYSFRVPSWRCMRSFSEMHRSS